MAHSGLWASPDAAPGAAPVRGPQDRAPVSHGHAGAGARARHAKQVAGRAAGRAACGLWAGRSDKRPPSGGATSTSGSSTDSNRSRDSPENISSTSLVLFPRAPRRRPNNPRTTATVVAAFTSCSPQPAWSGRGGRQRDGAVWLDPPPLWRCSLTMTAVAQRWVP